MPLTWYMDNRIQRRDEIDRFFGKRDGAHVGLEKDAVGDIHRGLAQHRGGKVDPHVREPLSQVGTHREPRAAAQLDSPEYG